MFPKDTAMVSFSFKAHAYSFSKYKKTGQQNPIAIGLKPGLWITVTILPKRYWIKFFSHSSPQNQQDWEQDGFKFELLT